MPNLQEGTRYTILINTEINRLRKGFEKHYFYGVANAVGIKKAVWTMWIATPEWRDKIRSAGYPPKTPYCPNPSCGAPLEHLHDCNNDRS
jgi:hypothetical protein